jgi:hypothetical protein
LTFRDAQSGHRCAPPEVRFDFDAQMVIAI